MSDPSTSPHDERPSPEPQASAPHVLPVLQEFLQIHQERELVGRVRVRKEVHEDTVPVNTRTVHETVETERVPVNRAVNEKRAPWQTDEALVIPVYEERLVRQLFLVEELHVRKRSETVAQSGTAALRREQVLVERLGPPSHFSNPPAAQAEWRHVMQSVIGVFDTQEDAESARESLIRAGFDQADVRVQSQRSLQERSGLPSRSESEDEGFMARIGHFFSDLFGSSDDNAGHYAEHVRRGGTVVVVDVEDDSRVDAARSALASAGAVDIDRRTEAWREEGYTGFDASSRPYGDDEMEAERSRTRNERVLPVVEEELEVGKRRVDLGVVRVVSRVETRPVQEQVELREEHAEIERRPVDRPATEADLRAGDRGAIELEESTERPVVSKTARVVEEVSVGKRSSSRTETVSDELRNTVVDVEKSGAAAGSSYSTTGSGSDTLSAARTFSEGDDASGSDMSWQQRGASAPAYDERQARGGSMSEDDEMAYRYGSTLRSDQRYADRSWDDVEADARSDWSLRHPGSSWERAKAAVREGWESMTGRR